MSLINKTFKDNVTGQTMQVANISDGIAIMTNDERVMVSRLNDSVHYTDISNGAVSNNMSSDVVDPASFFERDNGNLMNSIMDKVKSISTDGMIDDNTVNNAMSTSANQYSPNTNESAVVQISEEDERAELMRKYNMQEQPQTIDPDDLIKGAKPQQTESVQTQQPIQQVQTQPVQPPVQQVQVEDPIIGMFRNAKRNVDFDMEFKINGKIPRVDFIELMEDSYNISIVDFLAEEFTRDLLNDPSKIKEMVKSEINKLVGIVDEVVEPPKPKTPRKPRAKTPAKPKAKTPRKPRAKTKPKDKTPVKPKTEKINTNVLPDFKHTPEPPSPPKDRVLKEGEQPEKPNSDK